MAVKTVEALLARACPMRVACRDAAVHLCEAERFGDGVVQRCTCTTNHTNPKPHTGLQRCTCMRRHAWAGDAPDTCRAASSRTAGRSLSPGHPDSSRPPLPTPP